MKRPTIRAISSGILLAFCGLAAHAGVVYTEDFEAPFPTWKSGWFGANSNATNVYCHLDGACGNRGNNPDGLWIATTTQGSGQADVRFNAGFGDSLSEFSLDVAGFGATVLTAFDKNGVQIFSQQVVLTAGAFSDPGLYSHYTISSSNGISGFSFSGLAIGSTSIDNLRAVQGGVNNVPEPSSMLLIGTGLAALGAAARRRKSTGN